MEFWGSVRSSSGSDRSSGDRVVLRSYMRGVDVGVRDPVPYSDSSSEL